ncbi:ABC transporter ATP-binding protein [Chryseosolibacter indicus]|uniref:ABC transporter ATP-binding protein n=1 Tax=Chryseosolibacter indicus TaxID=2782351 RepID=A0ABS5VRF5_9BACT|nr:ABC transporter ATP-binding protein [Chryseosolibacter indicus]MBT1703372.1 ABC transporter ATP-binding protein [Chryseosolibacter indicus]
MTLLQVTGISKKNETNAVLHDINFSQKKYEKIAIAGETGSGKSTLLKIIAGLEQPDDGEVLFEDKKVVGPFDKLVPGHADIAYLSQHFELPKFLRVEQVLTYANTLSDFQAAEIFEVCKIDHLLTRGTNQLSGGEKQRVALCKLLIASPKLLLLDEPFSHLDMVHKAVLKAVINDIGKRLKITCILVSHDPNDTLPWANKILVIKNGEIVQKGKPEKIYRQPVNEYVGGLFGTYNLIPPDIYKSFVSENNVSGKQLFVRPEDLKVVSKTRKTVIGVVDEVIFHGSYYDINIDVQGSTVIVRSSMCTHSSGDQVHLSLHSPDLWYL